MITTPYIWTIVLNWKQCAATCVCLESLLPTVAPSSVIVIDNGSHDGSVEQFRARFPDIVILPLPENLGFARAVNRGIRWAMSKGAEGIFLLNNDTIVAPDTVSQLATWMWASPQRGMVSAKVFLRDNPTRLWAVGGKFTGRRVLHLGADEVDYGQYDAYPLDYVYVCAALLKVEMLKVVGCFDEWFFMYYEDIDLSLRARAAGYEISLAPAAHVWHHGSFSTRDKPDLKLFYEACSRLIFFAKHLPTGQHPLFYAEELRYVLAMLLRWLHAGNLHAASAYLRGCAAALTGSPPPHAWFRP